MRALTAGAMAVAIASHVPHLALGARVSEGYLSQPMLLGNARSPGGRLRAYLTVNLEGATLRRGEVTPGAAGESYFDRRHPHTWLHEAVAGALGAAGPTRYSIFAGKGFAPFGTDDPMVRPFAKYPANHHLSQIMERALVIGAIAAGPFSLEAGTFNGDEPEGASDWPNADRAFDSWSLRGTVRPRPSLELSGSAAKVLSPEDAGGDGLDQRKLNLAARYEGDARGGRWRYALVEWSRTREYRGAQQAFEFTSALAESEWRIWRGTAAVRLERTERPEEDRLASPYRSVRPLLDFSILGKTRWEIATVHAGAPAVAVSRVRFVPFVEAAYHRATAVVRPTSYDPAEFYGRTRLWMVSAGVRMHAGSMRARFGRYGVAAGAGNGTAAGYL